MDIDEKIVIYVHTFFNEAKVEPHCPGKCFLTVKETKGKDKNIDSRL